MSASSTLITSVLDVSANWLILRFVHAALFGIVHENFDSSRSTHGAGPRDDKVDQHVLLVSFLRPLTLWIELGRKVGLDVQALVSAKRLTYINRLAGPFTGVKLSTGPGQTVDCALRTMTDFESTVRGAIASLGKKTTLIIDGMDFLIASQAGVTAVNLSQVLLKLRTDVGQTIVSCSADAPLLHDGTTSGTPLERAHLAFLAIVGHQSDTIMQLRNLDTGAARDVSGVLRISNGGMYDSPGDDSDGKEGEWLYQVKGDGSVRVWSR